MLFNWRKQETMKQFSLKFDYSRREKNARVHCPQKHFGFAEFFMLPVALQAHEITILYLSAKQGNNSKSRNELFMLTMHEKYENEEGVLEKVKSNKINIR